MKTTPTHSSVVIAFIGATLIFTGGCASKKVEPWERGDLARQEMSWEPDPQLYAYRSHAYFSKEASSGGATVGGGGCGCN